MNDRTERTKYIIIQGSSPTIKYSA